MYKMAGIFSQRSTRYDYLMVRAERKQRAKKGKPGRWKQPEIQATAKEAAEIAAQIEADLERRLEDMRRPGAIEDDRQHFSAYSEEVCGRKPEHLTVFEWHRVELAYALGIPANDVMDFVKQFNGRVAEIKEMIERLDSFTDRILSRRGFALRAQLFKIALEREKSERRSQETTASKSAGR